MPSNRSDYEQIGANNFQFLDTNAEDTICKLHGLTQSGWRWFLYHLLTLPLLGLPYLVFNWVPKLQTLKYRKCSLKQATFVLLIDSHKNNQIIKVYITNIRLPNVGYVDLRYFYYQHTRYVWVPQQECFSSIEGLVPPLTTDRYLENVEGLLESDYKHLMKLYGPNKIDIEVKSYWELLIKEIFNPFYVFQAFSIALWCVDHYYVYAICVLILTFFSVITALLQTKKQSEALHDLVESSKCQSVTVLRQNLLAVNVPEDIDPADLVPGDLVMLPKAKFILPCDLVLLTGECKVNESMLTGESVPVTKTTLHSSNETYNPSMHKRHTLFCGTLMIQSRFYGGKPVLARVVRTGFDTTKGALIKSILYPTPVNLQFYKDSFKFIFVLFLIAAVGTGYCLYIYFHRKVAIKEMVTRSLDIITIVVPPALPAAMTVGIVYSQNRLKYLKIFCISPPRINVCGKIKLACFDKTGTLTQDGLDMHLVIPSVDASFTDPITDSSSLDVHSKLLQAMAACHELTQIDGSITGDPLDLSMFEFTGWELEEPGDDETARFDMLAPTIVKPKKKVMCTLSEAGDGSQFPYEIGIIRQFPFSSTLQCMSVICRDINSKCMTSFTKGAPEKIAGMCLPQTLPEDFYDRLATYAAKGYRVIALAHKQLPVKFKWKEAQRCNSEVVQHDLDFLGLIVLQNTLKAETAPVIRVLHNANIRTAMITGDNILTAVSVARDCEMIKPHEQIFVLEIKADDENSVPQIVLQNIASETDHSSVAINIDHYHFAIDGKTWNKIKTFYPDLLPELLVRTTVFARFQPDQKTQLITYFQSLDYVVSMVGDGANDCGALKAAHVGVSLSEAEASVAAPFTSSIPNISCIIHLILEGRCALVTSFAVFKYMALYSLIQFSTVLILYKHHSTLGDVQFLFIDLVITTTLAVTIGRQGPAHKLGPKRPTGSLVSVSTLIPIILQVTTCVLVQAGALYYLFLQKNWFIPIHGKEEKITCWENTVLFAVSCFQYIVMAVVYSKGRPYRQKLITNFWFLVSTLALTIFLVWLVMLPSAKVAEFFEIMYLPRHASREQVNFRYTLMLFPLCHLIISYLIEVGIADRIWLKKIIQCMRRKRAPKNKYKLLLEERNDFRSWRSGNLTNI